MQRKFIDLAAALGVEYATMDNGWRDWDAPRETLKALCDHGRNKGVGVWMCGCIERTFLTRRTATNR